MSFTKWVQSRRPQPQRVVKEAHFSPRPAPRPLEILTPDLNDNASYEEELQAAVVAQLSGDDDDEERPEHYMTATRGVMTRVVKPEVRQAMREVAAGLRGASGRGEQ